jgi:sulfoxide reductase catalytic subunit YedY
VSDGRAFAHAAGERRGQLAMSPGVAARFPWYLRLFGGRQPARSLHFIALVAMSAFTVGHVALVAIDDLPGKMAWIVHGQNTLATRSIVVGAAGLVVVVVSSSFMRKV